MKRMMYYAMVTVMLIVTVFGGATIARLVNSLFTPLIVVRLSILLYIIIITHYIYYVNTFLFFFLFIVSNSCSLREEHVFAS